jgi:hypothetical protein
VDILITGTISALALLFLHYAPWRMWLHRDLSRNQAYAVGTAALVLPQIACLLISPAVWDGPRAAVLITVVTAMGGAAVVWAYWADDFARTKAENDLHKDLSDGERDRPA